MLLIQIILLDTYRQNKISDLDSAINRLEAATATILSAPVPQRPSTNATKTYNGITFSAKCHGETAQLTKGPENLRKAIRKAVKDIFTKAELASATPAGGGGKSALDQTRLDAAKRKLPLQFLLNTIHQEKHHVYVMFM